MLIQTTVIYAGANEEAANQTDLAVVADIRSNYE